MAHQSSLPVWDRNYSPEPAEGAEVLKASDRINLTFANTEIFQQHVHENAEQILATMNRLKEQFFKLSDKYANSKEQNRTHVKERTTYFQANDQLMIENAQLEGENVGLRQQLAEALNANQYVDGSKKGEFQKGDFQHIPSNYSRSITPPSPSLAYAQSMHAHVHPAAQRSAKIPDPEVFTGKDMDVDIWVGRMERKLEANADHWSTEAMRIAYVESRIGGKAVTHIAARLRKNAIKPIYKAEEILEVLTRAYGDPNKKQTAMSKFRTLIMTKEFNSFWADFQALASEIEYNEATLIQELSHKITPALSQAMLSAKIPDDLHQYANQCEETYQKIKQLQLRIGTSAERFTKRRTPMDSAQLPTSSLYAKRPVATTSPSRSSSTYRAGRSDEVRLTPDELARLRKENRCFRCKEVGDHRPRCDREWQPMSVLPAAVNEMAVREVAVPQSGHVSENI